MTIRKRSKLRLAVTWATSLAAVGLIVLTVSHVQGKVADANARLAPSETALMENIDSSKDVAEKVDESLNLTAPRVSVLSVEPDSYRATIQAFGEVKPQTTLILNSETSGRIEWVAPEFAVGGRIKAGDIVVKVSQRNYLTNQANAEQEQANARQESIAAQQELSNAYQDVVAAEQEMLNAKQGVPNAYQSIASADQAIASASQGVASADQGVANARQVIASAQEAIATAQQELKASYQEIASAEQALKQELQEARTVNQPWNGADAIANAQQEVKNALLAVKQEKAQALLAQEEWKRAGMKGRPSELASRQPQLAAANARFSAAKIALQKAEYEQQQQRGELGQRKPQIRSAQARIETARSRLTAAQKRLITAKQQAVTAQKQTVTAQRQTIAAQKQTVAAKAQANANRGSINVANAQIKTAKARMNSARARVKSAKARIATSGVRLKTAQVTLDKAAYDLKSTAIRAPFNAIVSSKSVSIGSYVNAGANLGELLSSDAAEITLALSMGQANQLATGDNSNVELRSDDYPGVVWQGTIDRMADYLKPETRTRDVIIRVNKPLDQATPLLTGSFVSATLQGKAQDDLLKIPSSALSADGYLWFVDGANKLQRIERNVRFSQDKALFVNAPEAVNELNIVRWPLASYLPGMAVTPANEDAAEQAANSINSTDAKLADASGAAQ